MSGTRPTPETRRQHTGRVQRGRRTVATVLIVLTGLVMLDTLFGERGLLALVRTRQQHQALAAEVERSHAANDRLREEVRRLNIDPSAIEDLARRDLGMIKPGEKLFIIRDVPSPQPAR
jgi:cell division protein FtsB